MPTPSFGPTAAARSVRMSSSGAMSRVATRKRPRPSARRTAQGRHGVPCAAQYSGLEGGGERYRAAGSVHPGVGLATELHQVALVTGPGAVGSQAEETLPRQLRPLSNLLNQLVLHVQSTSLTLIHSSAGGNRNYSTPFLLRTL